MADYFTYFSVILPLTKDQQEYALKLVNAVETFRNEGQALPPDFPPSIREVVEDWPFDVETVKDGLWVHSEFGGQDSLCVFIQHLLQQLKFAGAVSFEWSHDCNKHKTDAYGGGAAFITATEIETFTTAEWLREIATHS